MRRLLQTTLLTLVVALSGCVASRTTVVRGVAPGVVTVETFDSALSPYGNWIYLPGYGRVWQPSASYVGADFYPYGTGGQWVMSDAGWVFDSALPFSWAVFHYGRWHRDPYRGWCWLPGTQWAPAWVSWRTGGPYVGWAPLGPYGAPAYAQSTWTFVETRRFTGRDAYRYSVGPGRFHEAVSVTTPYRAGPPAQSISRATNERIRPVPVERLRTSRGPIPPPPPSQRSFGGPAPTPSQTLPPPSGYSRGNQPLPPPPSANEGYRRDGFSAPNRAYAPPPSAPAPQYSKPPSSGAPRSAPSWGRSSAPPPPPPSMNRPSYRSPSRSMPSRSMPSSRPAPPPPPRR